MAQIISNNGWHMSSAVIMTYRHVTFTCLWVSRCLSLAKGESNVGSEAHPVQKVAITIDTSFSCSEKVPTDQYENSYIT